MIVIGMMMFYLMRNPVILRSSISPFHVAHYDGLNLISHNSGDSFNDITFERVDVIPAGLTIVLADGTIHRLRDLAGDAEQVAQLFEPPAIDPQIGGKTYGNANLQFRVQKGATQSVLIRHEFNSDNLVTMFDGRTFELPIARSEMEAMFGTDYRLERIE